MKCSCCNNESTLFMDFGNVALAGAFLKPEEFQSEKKYPLKLYFCENCYLVEVEEKIEPDILFKKYFYCSSTIPKLNRHFKEYAEYITNRFKPESVIEIGCNDGVMLRHLMDRARYVIGIDPANIIDHKQEWTKGGCIHNHYFNNVAKELQISDLIIANNVFAHIADIKQTIENIKNCLAPSGVFVFEVHSLLEMIQKTQYDWVYHEHIYYYSLIALENLFKEYGMRIFDVENTGLHAGSRRYYVCKDDRQEASHVEKVRIEEEALKDINTFRMFTQKAEYHKIRLTNLLNGLKSEGKTIAGWGACGRANTMIQYCDINQLEYMIDDSEVKHGYYTPSSHFEIRPYSSMDIPDYILVFAWSFLPDIIKRCKNVIVPLPNIHIKERI